MNKGSATLLPARARVGRVYTVRTQPLKHALYLRYMLWQPLDNSIVNFESTGGPGFSRPTGWCAAHSSLGGNDLRVCPTNRCHNALLSVFCKVFSGKPLPQFGPLFGSRTILVSATRLPALRRESQRNEPCGRSGPRRFTRTPTLGWPLLSQRVRGREGACGGLASRGRHAPEARPPREPARRCNQNNGGGVLHRAMLP